MKSIVAVKEGRLGRYRKQTVYSNKQGTETNSENEREQLSRAFCN